MSEEKFCKSCGKSIKNDYEVCPYCGAITDNKIISEKDWLVCLILLIFTGMLGIHKFYVGRNSGGIVMLILTISCIGSIASFVLWIIDLIQLVSGNFKDTEGKYLKSYKKIN